MKLYNAASQQVEPFVPLGDTVTIYVCGVTPYDTTHLGHAFTYVTFDSLIRYLEGTDQPVRYVQNVTDIDDDILRKAKEVGMDWRELAQRETNRFLEDLAALNVRSPDVYPYATQEIDMILKLALGLLDKGVAYERNGNVYYRVKSDPEFGKLSRYDYDTMLATANQRGNFPDDPNKEDPLDFVLWQAGKPGEPKWESPWSAGRPGWHIECSAMSMRYLGSTIDIHGGGADLLFPHHECERAQSEKYSGQSPFVRFWMHTAMVRMDGEKMSKSLGNMVFVRDLLNSYVADDIRAYLLSYHYRTPFEWNADEMAQAAKRAATWRKALNEPINSSEGTTLEVQSDVEAFHSAMQDDLNTPLALIIFDTLSNAILSANKIEQNISIAQKELRKLVNMIGFTFEG